MQQLLWQELFCDVDIAHLRKEMSVNAELVDGEGKLASLTIACERAKHEVDQGRAAELKEDKETWEKEKVESSIPETEDDEQECPSTPVLPVPFPHETVDDEQECPSTPETEYDGQECPTTPVSTPPTCPPSIHRQRYNMAARGHRTLARRRGNRMVARRRANRMVAPRRRPEPFSPYQNCDMLDNGSPV